MEPPGCVTLPSDSQPKSLSSSAFLFSLRYPILSFSMSLCSTHTVFLFFLRVVGTSCTPVFRVFHVASEWPDVGKVKGSLFDDHFAADKGWATNERIRTNEARVAARSYFVSNDVESFESLLRKLSTFLLNYQYARFLEIPCIYDWFNFLHIPYI